MKALEQNYRKGTLKVVNLPKPVAGRGRVVVRTAASLASVGTERGMVELARKSLLGKALARPDLVKQVIDKVRTEGIGEAWRQAMGRLETPILLGYSSAGTVVDVGPDVTSFRSGDRVACSGSGYAAHIELASVPANLCTPIPDGVPFEDASFVAIGGIALEAVRMARVELGARVVVIGLGLLGQIAVQLLRASGCHVFGADIDPEKTELASRHGAEATDAGGSTIAAVNAWTAGRGADTVIIMASTDSNDPLEQAAGMCRERGRIVATGMVGLEVPRRAFYDRELELVVSRAWGPGLYDPRYAKEATDYPLPYPRWTAKRNMEEFLGQLAGGAVSVKHLVTHRFPIDNAVEAYEMILEGREPCIGVVLTYPDPADQGGDKSAGVLDAPRRDEAERSAPSTVWLKKRTGTTSTPAGTVGIGLIGAGLYASGTFLPVLKRIKGLSLRGIATNTGLAGRHAGSKYGFEYFTTDTRELLQDPAVELVFILTRHDSHGRLVVEALRAGKHVFVEKPLALDLDQLCSIAAAHREASTSGRPAQTLMVGFNRRFSRMASWLKGRFEGIAEPLSVNCVVNAGSMPLDSWINHPDEGGGRIIGEVCHFVDLVQYLTSSLPVRVYVESVGAGGGQADDSIVSTLTMANGSIASIAYLANGDKRHPRERIEVFGGGAVGTIDNFKAASFIRNGRRRRLRNRLSVDRGHREEILALMSSIRARGASSVAFDEYLSTTLTTYAMERSLKTGRPEAVAHAGLYETGDPATA